MLFITCIYKHIVVYTTFIVNSTIYNKYCKYKDIIVYATIIVYSTIYNKCCIYNNMFVYIGGK